LKVFPHFKRIYRNRSVKEHNWGLIKVKLNKKHLIPVVLLLVMSVFLSGCKILKDTSAEFEVKKFLTRVAKDSMKLDGKKISKLYAYPIVAGEEEFWEADVIEVCRILAKEYDARDFRVFKQKFNYENATIFIEGDIAIIEGAVMNWKGIEKSKETPPGTTVPVDFTLIKVNKQWKIVEPYIFIPDVESVRSTRSTARSSARLLSVDSIN